MNLPENLPQEPPPEKPMPFYGAVPGGGARLPKFAALIPIVVMLLVGFATFIFQKNNGSFDFRSRASGVVPTPMPTNSVPLATNALQLKTITLALLSLNSDRKKVSGSQADALFLQIQKLANERNVLLQAALRTDPKIISDSLLRDSVVADFPAELQSLFEHEFAKTGRLSHENSQYIFQVDGIDYLVYTIDPEKITGENITITGFLIHDNLFVLQLPRSNSNVQGVSTAKKCTVVKPIVYLLPENQFGRQGEQLVYQLSINNMNLGCVNENFSITFSSPTIALQLPKPQSVKVSEGATVNIPISAFSKTDAIPGAQQFFANVQPEGKPQFLVNVSAAYTVYPR